MMKDNREQKFQKMQLILKISKTNMIWQKSEEVKVQILENRKHKALQKEQQMYYQELYRAMIKVKILLDLDLLKFKEDENLFK